jgi:NhaA family Na+:H+ antiporter
MLYGTAALCGIGFTMSLFIGSLAFDASREGALYTVAFDERLGIIIGSIAAGLLGYLLIKRALPSPVAQSD